VTAAISGIFMETHDNPKKAPSDGPNMVPLKKLGKLIHSIKLYDNLSKNELI
jgi:2-dehydro-3-deoxyphosphooctonate aldolase (KDO 8-P synthase)